MKSPMTNAIRVVQKYKIPYELMEYKYEEHGGTRVSARELGVDEHCVIKTILMQTDANVPFIVLMHGDREISTKEMARILGVKSVHPCDPKDADKHSGYHVGGTSPFGTKKAMRVYVEATIFELAEIYINAGSRGLLFKMDPNDLGKALPVVPVCAAQA